MANATEKPKVGYVTVATVRNREEARRLADKLAAAKIDHFIADGRGVADRGGIVIRLGEFKVQVHRAEVQAALYALGQIEQEKNFHLSADDGIFYQAIRVTGSFGSRIRILLEIGALVAVAAALAALIF